MFSSFRGGILPPQRKTLTRNAGIVNLSVPQVCYISMNQHAGTPAQPVVKIGDIVSEGELIGKASGPVSANVHASVPGKIIDIADMVFSGTSQKVVVIEAEGAFTTTGSAAGMNDWRKYEKTELLEMVRESGIAGMGGEAYPAAVKIDSALKMKADTLLVNGAESEPYLTVDDMMMKSYPLEIIEGIMITMKITGIGKAIIGVEDNKKNSIKVLNEAIKRINPEEKISVKQLRTRYPRGAEKQFVYSILGRTVPPGESSMNAGVLVFNIGTIFAIRESVLYNKPMINRCITVSGRMINRPGNYKVRIGTKISDIIEECGGLKGTPAKIILGGPMRGYSVNNTELPVGKGTTGILFLSEKETCNADYSPCIRCGRCVSVCPAGLVPRDIAEAAENENFKLAENLHANTCIMCSCCSFVCPAKRPLSFFIKIAQQTVL